MIIKRYSDFILERLGVPDNIVNSSEKLYTSILDMFGSYPDNLSFVDISYIQKNDKEISASKDISLDILIGQLNFKKIFFSVNIFLKDQDLDVVSWGVSFPDFKTDDYKIIHDKTDSISLSITLIASKDSKFSDIKTYLENDRVRTIGTLSHELKHVYDKHMIGHQLLSDVIDYQTWSRTSTGFDELDKFIYYLYLTSETENLVRPSQVAGYIQASDITKSEFKEFIEETRIYKELIKIKNWSYEQLKKDLLNGIDEIRNQFNGIPESESDEDVVDVVLQISYKSLMNKSVELIEDILDLNNPIKLLTGRIKESDIDFYNNYFKKRIFKNHDEFFLFWEKKLNFVAEGVIKKIVKLYDMCKDDNVNPLMVKINDRVKGQCIINPKAYKEIVLGNKVDKVKYPK